MNIYQKLIEIRKTCEYLKKDNQGYQFNYVSSSQTLGTLRAAMDENGLLLVPSVESYEVRDHQTKNGSHEYFTILKMVFTWVNADNPEEKVSCPWTGQGLDNGEKGVGKALTYAEKYFLLKFFNIATDKDDPDSNQSKTQPEQQSSQGKQDKGWYNDFKQHKESWIKRLNSGECVNPQAIISKLVDEGYKLNTETRQDILALVSEIDKKFEEVKNDRTNGLKKDMQHN